MKKYTAVILPFFTAILILSAFLAPREAAATVGFVNQWPATPPIVSNSGASPVTGKFSVGAGNNRLLIVTVATEYSTVQAPTFTVSYGGQSLNSGNGGVILNNTTGNNKIWIGYLKEAGIVAAGSNKTLLVTPSITTNLTAVYATAAVFSGVDQTTPITGFNSVGRTTTATTTGPVAFTMTGNAGLTGNTGLSVYLVNWNNTTVGETTASTGYTQVRNYVVATNNFSLSASYKTTTGASAESITSTTTAAALGAVGGFGLNPAVRIATNTTCGDCHSNPPGDASARNTPPGQFRGSHEKHSGGNDMQYGYACDYCHYNVGGSAYNHSTGFKNITGSKLPGNAYGGGGFKKIAITISPELAFKTCSNTACHSSGRGANMGTVQYATSAVWATNGTTTCLSCHAGRAGANGTGAQANSSQGFKLTTTHSQHLKYPAANMNCQMCHGKTTSYDVATASLVLKNYTGMLYHANGSANVVFADLAYGSANSYQGDKRCSNVACHGGTTRSGWSYNATNNNHTCTHCHGTASGVSTANTNRNYYAPGYNGGTSTDGISVATDIRVGGHFVHLSSVYMSKLKCNECHTVPSTPFEGNHMTGTRYNSASINFSQASTAIKNTTSTAFTAGTAVTAATCTTTFCHGSKMLKGDTGGTNKSPLWNENLTTGAPGAAECARCHGNPPVFGSSSSAHIGSAATISCVGCHKGVTDATGKIINKAAHINGTLTIVVDTAVTSTCHSCHGNPPVLLKYGRYSGLVKTPKTLALGASPANVGAHAKHKASGLTCNTCHNNNYAGGHPDNKIQVFFRISASTITGWNTTAQRAAYGTYSGNIPTGGTPVDTVSSTLVRGTADSVNNSCNTYCHGGWANSNRNMNPRWTSGSAATACGACHGATAAKPPLVASHARHAGYSSAAPTFRQGYSFTCVKCHPNRSASDHIKGAVHVRFSTAVVGTTATYTKSGATLATGTGTRTYTTRGLAGDTPDGTCSNITCHSSGRAADMGTAQLATTVAWGNTTRNCLACHGGRTNATGVPARSTSNFTLSTTHSQHLKYPAANINCQTCHPRTVTDAATLKAYSGVKKHLNGVNDVRFTNLAYGSYTSYKRTVLGSSADTKNCTNIACHGGKTRGVWSNTAQNNDNTCVHCHGVSGTSAALPNTAANRKFFAPGWNNTGISTDGIAVNTDKRVGAHFVHLSSIYMSKLKCNECHTVPGSVFDGTHAQTTRFSSQSLSFTQASTAKDNSAPAAFTSGTSALSANCATVYCHGNNLKNSDTAGTARSPSWDANVTNGTAANDCGKCHGNPPGSVTGSHNGKAATVSCVDCHAMVVNGSGTIVNKTLHINGLVEATGGDCLGCHSALVAADFVRASRHVSNGTTTNIVTNFDCIVCHAEGDAASSGTTITTTTNHGGNSSAAVSLRNVDASVTGAGTVGTNFWNWPGRRATPVAKGSTYTTDRNNMDSFCMGCHDANGSSTIAVNNSNNGLIVGAAAVSTVRTATTVKGGVNSNTNAANLAQRPFNTEDNLRNTRDTAITGGGTTIGTHRLTTYGRVLNVKSQFNSGNAAGTAWASHHNLNQFVRRYTSNNTTAGTGLPAGVWTAYVTKENVTLNSTATTAGANAGLHCSDCHLNEVNAHGSVNSWYMLAGKATASDTDVTPTTSGTSTTTSETSCFRCHDAADYGEAGGGTEGRVDHSGRCNNIDVVTGTAVEAPFGNNCHACHGGYGNTALAVNQDVVGTGSTLRGRGALGAIHGNNETYTPGGGTATSRYRFMSGASMRFWNPAGTATTNWTAATTSGNNCYTLSAADQWGSCTKHSGGAGQTINKGRALSY